jgi:ribonucleoside-diphosphate reductase alpha chain
VKKTGMRNSNTMAIAPTATISNICGVSQSIEPAYQNLFVKSNMSGDFTVVNAQLVHDLKQRGLWDEVMVSDLKYFDGSIGQIDRIPDDLKALYATAFRDRLRLADRGGFAPAEVDRPGAVAQPLHRQPERQEARRVVSLRVEEGSQDDLLSALALATHVEKSTLKGTDGKLNAVSPTVAAAPIAINPDAAWGKACAIDDPDCEACQ